MDVNLFSVFRVSRAIIPMMLGKPAVIVNTASRAGKVPPIFNSAYAVAKAGVIMLTKTMAKELVKWRYGSMRSARGKCRTDLEQWRFGLEPEFFNSTVEEREEEMCKTIPLGCLGVPQDVPNSLRFWRRTHPGTLPARRLISTAANAWNC